MTKQAKKRQKQSADNNEQPPNREPAGQQPAGGPPGSGLSIWKIVLLALAVYLLLQWGFGMAGRGTRISYSAFRRHVQQNNVEHITVRGEKIQGTLKQEAEKKVGEEETTTYREFVTFLPSFGDDKLLAMLEDKGITIETRPKRDTDWWYVLLLIAPLGLLGFFFFMQYRQVQGQAGGLFNIGKSKAKRYTRSAERTTFDDVAGAEEAKAELQEVVSYLKNPERSRKLGGKIPKGMLLLGPPGCGKTLLARAVAGEADAPFFSITGSDFMEMFVGVGASRVRDLFQDAKASAPSIIFIDELDSIGRQRGAGLGGGHDEREQTLNQLLSEMDGFEPHESVIAMAATNRPDILDPALRRPGRFDRQVTVPTPKMKDRLAILKMYAGKKPFADSVDFEKLAKETPGFSGADLENLLNEAALIAGRREKQQIEDPDVEEARDKILMGLERKGLVLSEEERKLVAYHEAGHAITSLALPETHPVHKISIIPRSRAMGVTQRFPEEEKYVYKREYMRDQLCVMMGGRTAEEIVFETATTGAENDLKQATQLARRMVLEWGMSEDLMNIALGSEQKEVFLGQQLAQRRDYSEATAREVDSAVKKLLANAHEQTTDILRKRRKSLDDVVDRLIEREEIPGSELQKIVDENGEDDDGNDETSEGDNR